MSKEFKSGFCAVIGPPNAGKSTLINSILHYTLNIVSSKPQTTRNNILGIYNEQNAQIIFTDTPGIMREKYSFLDKTMDQSVHKALKGSDVILFVIDITEPWKEYESMIEQLALSQKLILVFNKIDNISEVQLVSVQCQYPCVFVSAREEIHITDLLIKIKSLLRDNIKYYPDDILSDRTERFFFKEYIREALLNHLHQEIPHSLFVDIDQVEESDPKITQIEATIYTDRESQRKIILGYKGDMIKKISTQSRLKIEDFLYKKVYLRITVKIFKNWKDNRDFLKKLEYY